MNMLSVRQLSCWFFFLVTFFSFGNDHEYYYSITEMKYNNGNKRLEISIKLAAHDLEYIFGKNKLCGNTPLKFEEKSKDLDECLSDYLCSNFNVKVKDRTTILEFIGKEYENDGYVFVYFEINDIPKKITEFELKNTIFNETYDHQKNITHFEYIQTDLTKKVETFYYSSTKTDHTFNINL